MKICMFLNSPIRGDQRVFKEARTLADAGYEVTIICNQEPEIASEIWKGIKIISIYRQPALLFPGRFTFDWIRTAFSLGPDFIHAHDLNTLGRAWIVSCFTGAKLIYDSHDYSLQIIADRKMCRLRRIYYRCKEGFLIRRSDRVIYVLSNMCKEAQKEFRIPRPAVVDNFPLASPVPRSRILHEKFSLPPASKIVIYEGVVVENRGLENLVLSAQWLNDGVIVVILGEGYLKKHLVQLTKDRGLEAQVKFIEKVNLADFPRFCATADVGIAIYSNKNLMGSSIKVFDYMRAGIPVIVSNIKVTQKVVVENKVGVVLNDLSPESIAHAITGLLDNPAQYERFRRQAILCWKEKYNWESEGKKLLELYREFKMEGRRKKICMFLNSPVVGDQRVFKEARTLSDAGFDVTILCNQKEDLPISSAWEGIRIMPLYRHPSPFVPLRFTFQWIRRAISLNPDVIHAHDLNTLARGYMTARLTGASLVYDSHDWCTETPATLRYPAYRRFYYRWKERLLARRAKKVIFPVPGLCTIAVEKLGVPVPACICNFPRGEFIPQNKLLRTELNISDRDRIVLYEGVMAGDRGLEEIVLSSRFIPDNIVIVFLGEGYLKKHLQGLVSSNKLEEKVKFVDVVPVDMLPFFCAGADAGIVIYKVEGLTTVHGWPTKVFDYLRAGLPVLISAGPEITRMVVAREAGKEIIEKNPEGIARAIRDIFSNEAEFQQLRRNAKETWKKKFNWESEAKKLLVLYDEIFSGSND